jgi:hypothetical protein
MNIRPPDLFCASRIAEISKGMSKATEQLPISAFAKESLADWDKSDGKVMPTRISHTLSYHPPHLFDSLSHASITGE